MNVNFVARNKVCEMEKSIDFIHLLGFGAFGYTMLSVSVSTFFYNDLTLPVQNITLFLGGIIQILAGIMAFFSGTTFLMTFFIGYGVCNLITAITSLMKIDNNFSFFGLMWIIEWLLFSIVMFAGSFRFSINIRIISGLITLILFLSFLQQFTIYSIVPAKMASVFGFICSICLIYMAQAGLWNITHEKQFFGLCSFYRKQEIANID